MSVLIAWRMMIAQSRQRRCHRPAFNNLRRPSGISARLPDLRRLAGEELNLFRELGEGEIVVMHPPHGQSTVRTGAAHKWFNFRGLQVFPKKPQGTF